MNEALISIRNFLLEKTLGAEGGIVCVKCGARILYKSAVLSLHAIEFGDGCAGWGQVMEMDIPYCPTCEPEPELSGCIHREYPSYVESHAERLAKTGREDYRTGLRMLTEGPRWLVFGLERGALLGWPNWVQGAVLTAWNRVVCLWCGHDDSELDTPEEFMPKHRGPRCAHCCAKLKVRQID